jgi:hypothetical protein
VVEGERHILLMVVEMWNK